MPRVTGTKNILPTTYDFRLSLIGVCVNIIYISNFPVISIFKTQKHKHVKNNLCNLEMCILINQILDLFLKITSSNPTNLKLFMYNSIINKVSEIHPNNGERIS